MCRRAALGAMATCRLEIMGLPDVHAYRRHARTVLQRSRHLWSGLNIPNKKPGEPLLEWASVLLTEIPDCDLCVHYSLKHQRSAGPGGPVALFERFCDDAVALGVSSVLLVTGPRGPPVDAVALLERLRGRRPGTAPGSRLRLGVAFNACLPSENEREAERQRLVRKLRTKLVDEVWLNCGSDAALLRAGAAFVRQTASKHEQSDVRVFGSVLRPNDAQLVQMNTRPWNGVHFGEEYLGSLDGMARVTAGVVAAYAAEGVEPIFESKVQNDDHIAQIENMLSRPLAADSEQITQPQSVEKEASPKPVVSEPPGANPPVRRWGRGGRGGRGGRS